MSKPCGDVFLGTVWVGDAEPISTCIKTADHPDWHTNGRTWWKLTPDMWQEPSK